jgi:hypothetical protein
LKIVCVLLALLVFVSGCAAQPVFETVSDQLDAPAMAQMRQLKVALPKEATTPTLQNEETGEFYLCDGYTLSIQTMQSGDLDATMRSLTGFSRDQLTVMETAKHGIKRYDCVWSAAGEGGDHVARAVILDDGNYHYAVTVMADFTSAGELAATWKSLLDTVRFSDTD